MSVSNQTNKVYGSGNGVTTVFSFSFKMFDVSEAYAYLINNVTGVVTGPLVYTTNFTITISSVTEGGTITFVVAPPTGYTWFLKRLVPYTQSAVIPSEGAFPGKQFENQLDLMTMMIIQANETISRALAFPITFTGTIPTLPTPQDGYALGWDGTTGLLKNILVDTATIALAVAACASSAAAAASSQSAAASSASAASSSASSATASAAAAAASAASINLPSPVGNARKLLQVKTDETGYQFLDLSAIADVIAMNGKILKFAKGADVASVAGTITLGDDGNYFDITGTNVITSITAKTAGTTVALQFDSTASLVDGSNLKLNGNFQGVAEAQILLISDGTNWFELSRSPISSSSVPTDIQIFTTSGTWIRPSSNTNRVLVEVWGGGGGGGGSENAGGVGGGGGGGGYAKGYISVTGNVTVTIGAKGTGGTSGLNDATAGGTSSFAGSTTISASGGGLGQNSSNIAGGTGGTGTNGQISIPGGNGNQGVSSGGPGISNGSGGHAFGFASSGPNSGSRDGVASQGFGAGGMAGIGTPRAGANGAPGLVIITC